MDDTNVSILHFGIHSVYTKMSDKFNLKNYHMKQIITLQIKQDLFSFDACIILS